ncbi:helix-turn-helix domain-containing protein [Nonomuraea roseoviolacea]|uniref:Transcriptional regulator with XRE-family HTH domain n=1 Tax=Nonomuraea roseoviolacea subsp. carminata TaxID=160689 RepID=A0ABT1KE18_9ACTN|nr:helix-turn-helix transcriptional regulator [Nonomuraea roseoviolacea]MCP2352258.1 transcriptional regulator with XRE-family HTH domain [Nonomuraea roseoviolacea subsp. carminata]
MHTIVAARLAALRHARGLSMKTAADAAGLNTSTVYRVEHGHVAPRESTTDTLLELYGVHDAAQRRHVLALLRGERRPGWFDAPEIPLWLSRFLALEDEAARVDAYAPMFVPALLQTPAYAEATVRACGHPGMTSQQVQAGAGTILRRQELLDRDGGPLVRAVVDRRALLDPPLACPADRVAQVDAIAAAARRPGVAVQVARPCTETGHLYHGPPFTLLGFAGRDRPGVLVLHLLHGSTVVDDPGTVEAHEEAFARLSRSAHDVAETPAVLDGIRAELTALTT